MKRTFGSIAGLLALIFALSSCAWLRQNRPLTEGEMRLVRIHAPEVIREGVNNNIVVDFQSVGEPQILSVCFRFASDEPQARVPSLFWYMQEAQSERLLWGTSPEMREDGGEHAVVSVPFCARAQSVQYGQTPPGSLTTVISPQAMLPLYRYLECYVEYRKDGKELKTNSVFLPIRTIP